MMESADDTPPSDRPAAPPRVEAAAGTHIGRRLVNADAFLLDERVGLYAVADGMGDMPRSSTIAQTALDAARESFLTPAWISATLAERSIEGAGWRLQAGVVEAHARLYAPSTPRELRLGTTLAAVVDCGSVLCLTHVGDSRVYLLRASKGRLALLTQDHTIAGDARGRGVPSEEAARLANARMLTQAIGVNHSAVIRPVVRSWEPGDVVLLSTDGLHDHLDEEVIADVLLGTADLAFAAHVLVERAVEGGGTDNATAVLLRRTS